MAGDLRQKGSSELEMRRIGHSTLSISVMSLGAAPFGGLYRVSSTADAVEAVDAAAAGGITHVDVAPHYGQGLAEQRIGAALAAQADCRMTVSTKVGRFLVPAAQSSAPRDNWPEALPFSTVYDVSPTGIHRSIADSTQRMGGRRAELLLLHDPDRYSTGDALRATIVDAYRTLSALRAEGTTTAIGLGVNGPEACHVALDVGQWDCVLLAGTHSVIRQDDLGLLDRCEAAAVSVLIGGPYMSGALAGGATWRYRPIPDDVARDIRRLDAICRLHGVPMQAAALQFPLRHPAVASVVVGMRSAAEVEANLAFLRQTIPGGLWSDLAREGLVASASLRAAEAWQ